MQSNSFMAPSEPTLLTYKMDQNRTIADVDKNLLNNTLNSRQFQNVNETGRSSVLSPSCQAKEPDSSPESARDELLLTCMNEAVVLQCE